jgi:activating signal cointegrator complex subunit 2
MPNNGEMTNAQPLLSPYPSSHTRNSLTASQLAQLNQYIASAVIQTLALSPAELNTPATHKFVSTYAKDTAFRVLQSLIWDDVDSQYSGDEVLSKQVLLLAEKLALSGPGIDIQTLLDLAIIYAPRYHSRAQALFLSVFNATPSLAGSIESEVIPAFTALLSHSHSSGLYELRKAAQCISSFLHVVPPEIVRVFLYHKDFIFAFANAYDERLFSIARSYGGLRVQQAVERGAIDEWERVWVETKVALIDGFHVLANQMLKDLSVASDDALATESERFFDLIFGLLDLPSSSTATHSDTASPSPTPFLDRSILADYQYAYDLAQSLVSVIGRSSEKDARIDVLETTLQSFDLEVNGVGNKKDAGALKLLLKSSHIPPSLNQVEKNGPVRNIKGKGRDMSNDNPVSLPPESISDQLDLDLKVSQVLDILPDYSPTYIRALLAHTAYPFRGSVEKVVEALLEGKAPAPNEVEGQPAVIEEIVPEDGGKFVYTRDRKNIFDSEVMDVSRVHFGKKRCVRNACTFILCVSEPLRADKTKEPSYVIESLSKR